MRECGRLPAIFSEKWHQMCASTFTTKAVFYTLTRHAEIT
jgi:hypothetical protein